MKSILLPLSLLTLTCLLSCTKKETQPVRSSYIDSSEVSVVSTFAGGHIGGADGDRMSARFTSPMDIVVASSGNIYLTDENKIRKISTSGIVVTLAGSDDEGTTDGPGIKARFNHPRGIAVDKAENLYIADYGNSRIRKITPDGTVSTLAGSGIEGSADGPGARATFTVPEGIAVDANGNIYIADTGNNKIRKISPLGIVSTLAGSVSGLADGPVASATFSAPYAIAVNATGDLFIADISGKIRKISSGVVSTFAGNSKSGWIDGVGASASFRVPAKIVIDASGNLYVTDELNSAVRKITPLGAVSTLAGNGNEGYVDGPGKTARFYLPYGIATDAAGNVYVTEPVNYRIRKITPVKS